MQKLSIFEVSEPYNPFSKEKMANQSPDENCFQETLLLSHEFYGGRSEKAVVSRSPALDDQIWKESIQKFCENLRDSIKSVTKKVKLNLQTFGLRRTMESAQLIMVCGYSP